MGGEGLTVRGGASGTVARLDDLDLAAARLRAAASVMASVAVGAARVAAGTWGSLTGPASPLTWLTAQRRLGRAVAGLPDGAVPVAARLAALAAAVRAATALYRGADAAAAATVHAVDVAVGRAVGQAVGRAAGNAVGALAAVPVIAAVLVRPDPAPARAPCGEGGPPGPPVPTPPAGAASSTGRASPAVPAVSTASVVPAVPPGLRALVDGATGLVEHAMAALPPAIDGFLGAVPSLALPAAAATSAPGVPADVPSAAGWVQRLGSRGPWLRESPEIRVTRRRVAAAAAPGGVAAVLGDIAALDPSRGAPPGTVRVLARTGADGRRAWIVEIPGTQSWSPRACRDPLDLTGDVAGMAGLATSGGALVTAALVGAGARPGEPVLLAGHSQGGIVAARLAADPAFRSAFTVTHVVTAGAPIAAVAVPRGVSVLAVEHVDDVVPRLDGAPNPDTPSWLTVSRPAIGSDGSPDRLGAHSLDDYRLTGQLVDSSPQAGLVRWRSGLEPFLAAPGAHATAWEVTGERVVTGRGGSPPP